MPKFDLAGNPLPEPNTPATSAPASSSMPGTVNPPPVSSSSPETPTRFDLAGNPISGGPAPAPQFPQGGMAGMPGAPEFAPPPQSGATWPPPPGGVNPYAPAQAANDSGMKAGVPPEIAALKWNWGAFSLTFLWCLNHRLIAAGVLFLLATIGLRLVNPMAALVLFIPQIYFGVAGNDLAWRNRHFPGGVQQFFDVQRAWMRWGVAILVLTFIGLVGSLYPVYLKSHDAAMQQGAGFTQQNYQQGAPPAGAPQ